MKTSFFKKVIKKVKGSGILRFLFFLLVSCSLWLSLTLNRVYETNISVCVHINNIPDGVKLVDGDKMQVAARIKGVGTAMFGYVFDNRVNVDVDYSDFVRNGGELVMPVSVIRRQVIGSMNSSLSLLGFSSDSLCATVQLASSTVPVVKDIRALGIAPGCELVSYKYTPDSVIVTAYIDVLPSITAVHTEPLVCQGLARDSVFKLRVLPGDYVGVSSDTVEVQVVASRFVKKYLPILVEYAEFPAGFQLGLLPQKATVCFEVLEVNAERVHPKDFSVKLWYEDYLKCIGENGSVAALNDAFELHCTSSYAKDVSLLLPEFSSFSSMLNIANWTVW